uniref:Hsp70-Hsp90 organising protein n=1 Tax=Odontella aurita TaxID=265563 RepID=A0A7S4N079_9STRA
MATADEWKGKGNQALQSGNATEAIECYTKAIDLDGSNHVYYSNRSAAYLKKGDGNNALEDAGSCVALNPNFAKGYSRKGAALHALKRYNDAIAAYNEGLGKFPEDKGLRTGLESVKRDKDGPAPGMGSMGGGANPMAGLFGPQMMAHIAMDPKLRDYMKDEKFMAKINEIQTDPNKMTEHLGDPRVMEVFRSVLGAQGMDIRTAEDEEKEDSERTAREERAKKARMEAEEKKKAEEAASKANAEENAMSENELAAKRAKERGNELYKSKKFEEALAAYDEAIELDPVCMTFHSNKAAVYFTTKKYDECIAACDKAVEVGKENRAPFEDRAKALTRAAKAYQKKGDMSKAIEMCKEANLEHIDKTTTRLLKTLELEKKKKDTMDYQDDAKAEEAKQRGNDHFRNKEWAKAVNEYEEAVKRAPKNAAIRNNLSAALCKIMDFNGAKRQIEEALEIDPRYLKAWSRKGDIEIVMKEYHKAMDSYKAGLAIEPENPTCKTGLQKVMGLINRSAASMTEEERKERAEHAMADPQIQAILTDPVVQQVLRDFNENPNAANQAMRDPGMKAKIEKLIASGIVQAG